MLLVFNRRCSHLFPKTESHINVWSEAMVAATIHQSILAIAVRDSLPGWLPPFTKCSAEEPHAIESVGC